MAHNSSTDAQNVCSEHLPQLKRTARVSIGRLRPGSSNSLCKTSVYHSPAPHVVLSTPAQISQENRELYTDLFFLLADRREFMKISQAVGMGFLIMGAIGYFIKLSESSSQICAVWCEAVSAGRLETDEI
jgi:hypothetical protein